MRLSLLFELRAGYYLSIVFAVTEEICYFFVEDICLKIGKNVQFSLILVELVSQNEESFWVGGG